VKNVSQDIENGLLEILDLVKILLILDVKDVKQDVNHVLIMSKFVLLVWKVTIY
jgi:hypothetical protein